MALLRSNNATTPTTTSLPNTMASIVTVSDNESSEEGRELACRSSNGMNNNQHQDTAAAMNSNSSQHQPSSSSSSLADGKLPAQDRELKPFPFFYYRNYSQEIDENPHFPLVPLMSVPNFVMKLHAMLSCDSLSNVIAWMPHGRSWKILDQSEFEKRVLPRYYTTQSIASFYRQANGWGFRRMHKGTDKGSFYNEQFLRGMPFLSKKLKRVGGAKVEVDATINNEPDLLTISDMYPPPLEVPKDTSDYIVLSIINRSIQEHGPKAKMPFIKLPASYDSQLQSSKTSSEANEDDRKVAVEAAAVLPPPPRPLSSTIDTVSSSLSSRNDPLIGLRQQLEINQCHIENLLRQNQQLAIQLQYQVLQIANTTQSIQQNQNYPIQANNMPNMPVVMFPDLPPIPDANTSQEDQELVASKQGPHGPSGGS